MRTVILGRIFANVRVGDVLNLDVSKPRGPQLDMLWHLVEEELQHRGELNALLWQEDIDPPVISWGEWKRQSRRGR